MNNPFESLESRLNTIENLLQELTTSMHHAAPTTSNDLMNVEEAAAFLHLAVPTIYSLVQRRLLPVNKRGKRLYFSRRELEEWVKQGKRKTEQEMRNEVGLILGRKRKPK